MVKLHATATQAAEAVLTGVDRSVERRWRLARDLAASTVGTTEERIVQAKKLFVREMTVVGAAAGATAAVPAAGAVGAVGAAAAEFGWFATRSADLILTVAAIHGHTAATVEQRRAWILSVLAFGNAASTGFTRLAGEVGRGLGERAACQVPPGALRAVNGAIGRTVVTRFGSARGAVALGRAFPFGIGAAIGGGANYAFARATARQADSFFSDLPPVLSGHTPPVTDRVAPHARR
jgi:hypothetical protein